MTADTPPLEASYELPLREASTDAPGGAATVPENFGKSLPDSLLAKNVVWFCRLRWIVIGIFMAFSVLGLSDGAMRLLGLRPPGNWPLVAAGVLTLCNALFLTHARFFNPLTKPRGITVNLWAQIALDLIVLTAVVHFLGSLRTYVPFAYLFHIVMACVFFSRAQSFIVTAIASLLLAACTTAEHLGIIAPVSAFADGGFGQGIEAGSGAFPVNMVSAVAIWLAVWYLASRLSMMLRQRDSELADTNRRLLAAQEERSRHMLTTTHQLKAPFAAIHANTQLLLKGHCGVLSDEALDVARRISDRCRRLAAEIQDMLQLANLSSASQHPLRPVELNLPEVLRWSVEQVAPLAQERGVALDVDIGPARAEGVEEHLKMLFSNLLSNAVSYSYEHGRVSVRCASRPPAGAIVIVRDEGIGIPSEKLPHIFEEHYRTKEAVRHNKESSGLGLAIVRQVAEYHRIRLRVTTRPCAGTTFELRFPPVGAVLRESGMKEKEDGISADSG